MSKDEGSVLGEDCSHVKSGGSRVSQGDCAYLTSDGTIGADGCDHLPPCGSCAAGAGNHLGGGSGNHLGSGGSGNHLVTAGDGSFLDPCANEGQPTFALGNILASEHPLWFWLGEHRTLGDHLASGEIERSRLSMICERC